MAPAISPPKSSKSPTCLIAIQTARDRRLSWDSLLTVRQGQSSFTIGLYNEVSSQAPRGPNPPPSAAKGDHTQHQLREADSNPETLDWILCIDQCRLFSTLISNPVRTRSRPPAEGTTLSSRPDSEQQQGSGREDTTSAPTQSYSPPCWPQNHSSHHWVVLHPRQPPPPTMRVHAPRRQLKCRMVLDLPAQQSRSFLTGKMT